VTAAGARYDGLADWYDQYNASAAAEHAQNLAAILGPGSGLCLDLGCGTGQYLDVIRGTGRTVVGLDYSADQLRVAARRGYPLIRGNGAALPFATGAFSAVVIMWVSTDVDDFAEILRGAFRVLRPGGLLVFYGVHPCFNGPCVESRADGGVVVHPTYRNAGWHDTSPWWKSNGIRRRIGMRHLPLPELINAFIDAGFSLERVAEPGEQPVPYAIAVRAVVTAPHDDNTNQALAH
jgi:ubiquinone/menaquinone biosynthesis C-methylase UbiE